MKIINATKSTTIASAAKKADSFLSRMIGLLNRTRLDKGEALVITQCQSIHMFFMKFAIDAIFVDKNDVVVGLIKAIKPNRLSRLYFRASYVIELPVGIIDESSTAMGDQLKYENI